MKSLPEPKPEITLQTRNWLTQFTALLFINLTFLLAMSLRKLFKILSDLDSLFRSPKRAKVNENKEIRDFKAIISDDILLNFWKNKQCQFTNLFKTYIWLAPSQMLQ